MWRHGLNASAAPKEGPLSWGDAANTAAPVDARLVLLSPTWEGIRVAERYVDDVFRRSIWPP